MPDRYEEPAKGSSDWNIPLNSNFSKLDIDVTVKEARAPDTNQESPDDGAMFLDTSTGEIYEGDGSAWNLKWNLGDIGSGGGGGGGWTQAEWTATESGNVASDGDSLWVITTDGNVTVTLPSPSANAQVRVKHQTDGGTGNVCEVAPNGTETIDGSTSPEPIPYNGSYTFECDGTNWETF